MKKIWELKDLPELKVGDGLAFKADLGFEEGIVGIMGAVTWHWAMAGQELPADDFSGADRVIVGSIVKGIAEELLSSYESRHMRVYRPQLPEGIQDALALPLLKRCYYYGACEYDFLGITNVTLWFLLRHFGLKWWMRKDMRFYCIEFLNQIWADFDFPLVDGGEPAMPSNMEDSPQLKCIWGTF